MRFFTSDLHFSHKNVIGFCQRPWPDIDAMNFGLICLWNETVKHEDEIFILGDLFFCGTQKAKEILIQLNGKKHWILGNHDWGKIKPERREEFGFESIKRYDVIRIGEHRVNLSHFPYVGDHTFEQRFLEERIEDNGDWLLHGHVHCEWKQRDRMINVGVDVWNYKPVSEVQLLEIIK